MALYRNNVPLVSAELQWLDLGRVQIIGHRFVYLLNDEQARMDDASFEKARSSNQVTDLFVRWGGCYQEIKENQSQRMIERCRQSSSLLMNSIIVLHNTNKTCLWFQLITSIEWPINLRKCRCTSSRPRIGRKLSHLCSTQHLKFNQLCLIPKKVHLNHL